MIKNKDIKILFFAEIGRTDLSSKASEELLNKLANRLNLYYKKNIANIYYYPIYNPTSNFNWIISLNKKSDKTYIKYFFSTSIKLARDLFYILNSLITIRRLKPKYSFFYNLNKLQISILSFIKIFIKTEINIIQADGYLLDKYSTNMFENIIVFSDYTYRFYKKYKKTKLYFSYPYIKDKKMKKFIPKFKNKNFNLLHAGSISKYKLFIMSSELFDNISYLNFVRYSQNVKFILQQVKKVFLNILASYLTKNLIISFIKVF